MSDLKPCPFCGELPVIQKVDSRISPYYVRCKNTKCSMWVATCNRDTEEEAIMLWNRRIKQVRGWNLQKAYDEGYKAGRDAVQHKWWERMREELTELHENNMDKPDVEGITRFLLNWMKVVEKE